MKTFQFLFFIIFILQSCAIVPGQYLSKHDPGFYSKKNDTNLQFAAENTERRYGISMGGNTALSNHFYVGMNAGIYKKFIRHSVNKMQGVSIRPQIGYFTNFGNDKNKYLEFHAGLGKQFNEYSFDGFYFRDEFNQIAGVSQIYCGAFMGFTKKGKKIGFDISYEYNYFNDPILTYETGYMEVMGEFPVEFIRQSYNVTTSIYLSKTLKNIDIFFNPGLNIGYTAAFLRLGVNWKL